MLAGMAPVGNLFFGLLIAYLVKCGISANGQTTNARSDDPMLEVVSRKNWSRPSHCQNSIEDGLETHEETGWKIDDINIFVEGLNATTVMFIIDNRTPRDFETLKMRVFLAQANTTPIDLEVGQIVQFSTYRLEKDIPGVSEMEDINYIQAIEGMHFYKIGIAAFQSSCSKSDRKRTHTLVRVQHEKNYAHSLANIHYLMNSLEFRRDFMAGKTTGTGWMQRQGHLDWLLNTKKYHLKFLVNHHSYAHNGGGSTWAISLKEWVHNGYTKDINGYFTFCMVHELYHSYSYGHSDFALNMDHPGRNQLRRFSRQGVVQPKIAPQERYTDFVGLNAVYNPAEKAVYIFSGYTFRILSMKEWSDTNLLVKDECLSRDPVTGQKCIDFGSPFRELNHVL